MMENTLLDKRLSRYVKLLPWFGGFSADLLFWVAVDSLFLTYVRHLSSAQIVSLTTICTFFAVIIQIPCLAIIKKIGNTNSVRLGLFFRLASALFITFGSNYYLIAVGYILTEFAAVFYNMLGVQLKNNLDIMNRGEDYLLLRSRAMTVYSIVTMVIAFVAGPMFNLNPFFPMYCCIFFCLLTFLTSFFMTDETEREKIVAPMQEEKPKKKHTYISLVWIGFASYALFYSLVVSGQTNGKLFIQETLQSIIGEGEAEQAQVVLFVSGMIIISRVVRTFANMIFAPIYRRLRDKSGFVLAFLLFLSVAFMLTGYFLQAGLYVRYAFMVFGYVLILFARDPFSIYIQTLIVENTRHDEMQAALTVMTLLARIFGLGMSLVFTALLLKFPLLYVIYILLGLTAVEIVIAFILYFKIMTSKASKECKIKTI